MNEHSSALRATVIGRAARAIEAAKLQVIDRDWQSGEHRLDLVATPGDGILAAVEVRAVAYSRSARLQFSVERRRKSILMASAQTPPILR